MGVNRVMRQGREPTAFYARNELHRGDRKLPGAESLDWRLRFPWDHDEVLEKLQDSQVVDQKCGCQGIRAGGVPDNRLAD